MQNYDEQTGLYYEIKDMEEHKYALITDADKKLAEVTVPDTLGDCPVEAIGKKAFLGCKGLRRVTLPAGIKSIGEWAFAFCDNLTCVNMARVRTALGKGVFKNDGRLRDISLYDMKPEGERETVSRLLAAAPIYMDAEYLLDTEHAGSSEWYDKWDTKLAHILSLKDDEGYHLYVLCGEEDLHFDYDQYLEYNREKKAYLCMLRLYNDTALDGSMRDVLRDYLLGHNTGCESDAAIRVLLRDFADDKGYYDLMIREGVITPANLEAVLLKMGDRHPQMKAFLIESIRGSSKDAAGSFFDELAL
ncbi:MAG: leucine-rich repeat domain-containing protein [Lachnospiraceae bacterium]|nr:leucine-rich repeat domain-containing protein [Lachnospiraceae bacterium]